MMVMAARIQEDKAGDIMEGKAEKSMSTRIYFVSEIIISSLPVQYPPIFLPFSWTQIYF
jgi:hypothetical protein